MEEQILKAIEQAYRKGLQDAEGLNDISPFLLTSQVVAQDLINKFWQTAVSKSLPSVPCECGQNFNPYLDGGICWHCETGNVC